MNSSVKTPPVFHDIESLSMDEIDAEIKCLRQRLNDLIQAQASKITPGFNAARLTQEEGSRSRAEYLAIIEVIRLHFNGVIPTPPSSA